MKKIDISYIITIYNKEIFIPFLIGTLKNQKINFITEYIFVDDNSSDDSLEILNAQTTKLRNVTIIKNTQNCGPSIRMNQGAFQAKGKYLYLLDADELIPNNATETLVTLLEQNDADFIYGKKVKTKQTIQNIHPLSLPQNVNYQISTSPLKTILSGKYVGMGLMTKRSIFNQAQGCDESVFIQDESLPLRLASVSTKFITLNHNIVFAPKAEGLSTNKQQQHYDRFMAYYNALLSFKNIDKEIKLKLYQRAVSSAWKAQKKEQHFLYKIKMLLLYLYAKKLAKNVSFSHLNKLKEYVVTLNSVRKI